MGGKKTITSDYNDFEEIIPTPDSLFKVIEALDEAILERERQFHCIERDYPEQKLTKGDNDRYKQRCNAVRGNFDEKWKSLLTDLDTLCQRIRKCQPRLSELTETNINIGRCFPNSLVLGRMCLTYENWKGYVPRLVSFPFKKSLYLPESQQKSDLRLIHQLLLRLIHCMPVGYFEIIAADPLQLGNSLGPFCVLLKSKQLFPKQRILTRSDELENALQQLTNHVEDLIQNKFQGKIKNWSAYNLVNNGNPIHYKLLLIFDVPEQLTEKSLSYLSRLIEWGPLCGVLPVLTIREEYLEKEERKFGALRKIINQHAQKIDSYIFETSFSHHISKISIKTDLEFWPQSSQLEKFLHFVCERYRESSAFQKTLTNLWRDTDCLTCDSSKGVSVPIGWTTDGHIVPFLVGGRQTSHHTLLGGRSGSGKSNLLHVLIHSLCHAYPPSELNIYLLDYKQGTEFNIYASIPLPQIKLVSVESDPEYGVTVLEYLVKELEKRSQIFKEQSVKELYEYRAIESLPKLPRVLLIIDEFQMLFSEERSVADRAEKALNLLFRQGRSFGIHIFLATQTITGIREVTSMRQLVSQIGCRIALSCSEEDSQLILGSHNSEASKLNSPPEGIINNANGDKSANQKFLIPCAVPDLCKDHAVEIARAAYERGYCNETKIFNGSKLPAMPSRKWFREKKCEELQLWLGESLNFTEEPIAPTLVHQYGSNLLISGCNEIIRKGLLTSIFESLEGKKNLDEIIYFNGKLTAQESVLPCNNTETPISCYTSLEMLDLSGFLRTLSTSKKILIINGLESIREFHNRPLGAMKNKEESSPQENIKEILEEGPSKGTFVIAFIENWKRFYSSSKDLLNFFEMRVGFCMNESDAGSFFYDQLKSFKGLEKSNRAFFLDRLKQQSIWFRPYHVDINEEI